MNWKEFLKPTIPKIIILLVLFGISTPFFSESHVCNPTSYGFPLKFFQFGGCVDVGPCIETTEPGSHIICESIGLIDLSEGVPAFIVNLIFWYLVSAIIWIYIKVKRK